jgi:hypothetical protein
MKKDFGPKRETADDKARRIVDYGMQLPPLVTVFSQYVKFTPISDMPYPDGIKDKFHGVFVLAAEQTGLIEFDEGKTMFRWTRKNELTSEENSQLNKKIIDVAMYG